MRRPGRHRFEALQGFVLGLPDGTLGGGVQLPLVRHSLARSYGNSFERDARVASPYLVKFMGVAVDWSGRFNLLARNIGPLLPHRLQRREDVAALALALDGGPCLLQLAKHLSDELPDFAWTRIDTLGTEEIGTRTGEHVVPTHDGVVLLVEGLEIFRGIVAQATLA